MKPTHLLMLTLLCGCAAAAPRQEAPEPQPSSWAETAPSSPTDPAPSAGGGRVLEVTPATPHGSCCTSDSDCGDITCEPSEYPTESCGRVCTLPCEPGDTCPPLGGVLGPPPECPESGLCPVGSPFV